MKTTTRPKGKNHPEIHTHQWEEGKKGEGHASSDRWGSMGEYGKSAAQSAPHQEGKKKKGKEIPIILNPGIKDFLKKEREGMRRVLLGNLAKLQQKKRGEGGRD